MIPVIEKLREHSVESCFNLSAFKKCWDIWKADITERLSGQVTADGILNLGDCLSAIFSQTGEAGRGQGELSAGGYGWEGLINWYLNFVMLGSNVVALRNIGSLPEPLRDAMTVNYGNFQSNTESDITIMVLPKVNNDSEELVDLNAFTRNHFNEFELGIIQSKTNWKDNAQIPMLWSMIYQATGFSDNTLTIGKNNFSISDLNKFSYSFVTVPSNKNALNYSPHNTPVNRVRNLTGGNYWGHPTKSGIANSLKEIFNHYRNGFTPDVRQSLDRALTGQSISYFRLT